MANTNGRKPNPNVQRISISMPDQTRRDIRIASAVEGMSEGEWCVMVLNKAADVAIPDEVKAAMKAKARAKAKARREA